MTIYDTAHNNRQQWIDEIKQIIDQENDIDIIQLCISYTLQSLKHGEDIHRFQWEKHKEHKKHKKNLCFQRFLYYPCTNMIVDELTGKKYTKIDKELCRLLNQENDRADKNAELLSMDTIMMWHNLQRVKESLITQKIHKDRYGYLTVRGAINTLNTLAQYGYGNYSLDIGYDTNFAYTNMKNHFIIDVANKKIKFQE